MKWGFYLSSSGVNDIEVESFSETNTHFSDALAATNFCENERGIRFVLSLLRTFSPELSELIFLYVFLSTSYLMMSTLSLYVQSIISTPSVSCCGNLRPATNSVRAFWCASWSRSSLLLQEEIDTAKIIYSINILNIGGILFIANRFYSTLNVAVLMRLPSS